MSKRDEQFKKDINATYTRRDRGELTEKQWMDALKRTHDRYKADVKADYQRGTGGTR